VQLPERLFEGSADDLLVTIDVAPAAVQLVADYIPEGAVTTEVNGRNRTTVRVSHYHGLKRLVASMPGVVAVVAPEEARLVVAGWAAAGAARYEGD
jgi:proteasome accessory factor C